FVQRLVVGAWHAFGGLLRDVGQFVGEQRPAARRFRRPLTGSQRDPRAAGDGPAARRLHGGRGFAGVEDADLREVMAETLYEWRAQGRGEGLAGVVLERVGGGRTGWHGAPRRAAQGAVEGVAGAAVGIRLAPAALGRRPRRRLGKRSEERRVGTEGG